jgi:hypothetical protein
LSGLRKCLRSKINRKAERYALLASDRYNPPRLVWRVGIALQCRRNQITCLQVVDAVLLFCGVAGLVY